ncbi:MAG: sulfatase-like hydrolase/transferase [Akkermansiaceae bacterium]|nr:sulfatase-like hydrolase/transferase [Akkermansiaceae bacterium]
MKNTCLTILVLACSAGYAFADEPERKPNIIMVLADDQGYADMGCSEFAKKDVSTPALDKLATEGTRFTQAYSSAPICNASRAGLITGVHQARMGVYWYVNPGIKDTRFQTIPEALKKAGYATGYVGKVHYGSGAPDARDFPTNHGFDYYFGFMGGRKHYMLHDDADEARFLELQKKAGRKTDNPVARKGGLTKFESLKMGAMWENKAKVNTRGLSTEIFGGKARDFITQHKDEPFYLQLSFNAVHNFTHQLPEDYKKAHGITGIIQDWDPAKEEYLDWYRKARFPNNPEGRATYLAHLHFLDLEIGRLSKHLETLGLKENTLVVYISDNGGSTPIYADNSPLRGSKYTLYEGGIRVPMIVRWPGKAPAGRVDAAVVSTLDLFPMICTAAGVKSTNRFDGQDLTGFFHRKQPSVPERTLVWDSGHEYAVRAGNWKYHVVNDTKDAELEMVKLEKGEFLYDLQSDPGETKNLAKENPGKLAEMKRIYQAWKKQMPEQ